MFICENCGHLFEDHKVIREHHPYGMGYASEDFYVCPNCGDDNTVTAKECSRCGEYFAELQDGFCDMCYGDMYGE